MIRIRPTWLQTELRSSWCWRSPHQEDSRNLPAVIYLPQPGLTWPSDSSGLRLVGPWCSKNPLNSSSETLEELFYLPGKDHCFGHVLMEAGSQEQTDSFVLKCIYFWCLECLKKRSCWQVEVGRDAAWQIRWSDGDQSDHRLNTSCVSCLTTCFCLSFCLSAGLLCDVLFFGEKKHRIFEQFTEFYWQSSETV